ncbi:MAG: hypothetical protein ACI3V2_05870 [Faecousia sp.]
MLYILVIIGVIVGEFVTYYLATNRAEGDKKAGTFAMFAFDLAFGPLLFGISYIEMTYYHNHHTDEAWYHFLFYFGLFLTICGIAGVISGIYDLLRDRDAHMVSALKEAMKNTNAATVPQGNVQFATAPTMPQQPMQPTQQMPAPSENATATRKAVRPTADPTNPYIISCPVCHTRQSSGRKVCFECGVEFEI